MAGRPTIRVERVQWFDTDPITDRAGQNAYPDMDGVVIYVIDGTHDVSDPATGYTWRPQGHMHQPFVRGSHRTYADRDGQNRNAWGWDGNRAAPSLTPSFLCEDMLPHGVSTDSVKLRVHLFFTAGKIALCADSNVDLG